MITKEECADYINANIDMTTKISRQLRIHIEEPNNCLEDEDNIYDNQYSTTAAVAPISNRNIVHKIKSVQSIDLTQPT